MFCSGIRTSPWVTLFSRNCARILQIIFQRVGMPLPSRVVPGYVCTPIQEGERAKRGCMSSCWIEKHDIQTQCGCTWEELKKQHAKRGFTLDAFSCKLTGAASWALVATDDNRDTSRNATSVSSDVGKRPRKLSVRVFDDMLKTYW